MEKTLLTQDFLRNELGYTIENVNDTIIYNQYYEFIMNAIYERNAFFPNEEDVEEILESGICKRLNFESNIQDKERRKELFLLATAYQLKYDQDNGRARMIRGENGQYELCEETKTFLSRIGLIKPVRY